MQLLFFEKYAKIKIAKIYSQKINIFGGDFL